MNLIWILATILAIAAAEEAEFENADALASMELLKTDVKELLEPSASSYDFAKSYIAPSQRPPKEWNNYAPQNAWTSPVTTFAPPQNSYIPPKNSYAPPLNTLVPIENNNFVQPQSDYIPPQNSWQQQPTAPPQNTWNQQQTYVPPQNSWNPPQNSYQPAAPTTTTPSPVIKNEHFYGENGSYKYEYQIADGTHVGEEGYYTDPKGTEESLVKKGWYSFPGADGKIYTVTYWADHTGYHASGAHLPTPPPVPQAIQQALDQQAKEEAAKAEAEKNKQQYPQQQQDYPPQQPTYYPPQQQPNYPQQTYPQQTYPQQTYPQQTYPQQPTYNPPQSSYGK